MFNAFRQFVAYVIDWVLWKWRDKKAADEIQEFIDDKRKHPWLKVGKNRSGIRNKLSGDVDCSLVVPTSEEKYANCSIELVKLKIKDKNISWWSLGLELFAGKKVSNDEMMEMKRITEYLFLYYRKEYRNNLKYTVSYSYPKLFSMNAKRNVFIYCTNWR